MEESFGLMIDESSVGEFGFPKDASKQAVLMVIRRGRQARGYFVFKPRISGVTLLWFRRAYRLLEFSSVHLKKNLNFFLNPSSLISSLDLPFFI